MKIRKTKDVEPGHVFVPYILGEHTEESLKEYDDFMDKYDKEHQCCPKCGSESCRTTLVGYPLVEGKESEYQDKNRCTCMGCGDVHITHDRKPK